MGRAIVIVLNSVGCGGAADAAAYGDEGADTLGHLAAYCAAGKGDRAGLRAGPLRLPALDALGLGLAMRASSGVERARIRLRAGAGANGATGSKPPGARIRRRAIGRSRARRSTSPGAISPRPFPPSRSR